MKWNTVKLNIHGAENEYRWRGVYSNGHPAEVQAWCHETKEFVDCPNINVRLRIAKNHIRSAPGGKWVII